MFLYFRKMIVLALLAACSAQAADDWTNVRALRRGDRIGVIQSGQKRLEGEFRDAGPDGMTIWTDREIQLTKDSVVRVYRRPGLSRKKRLAIGAAIGLAAGAAIAGGVADKSNNEGFFGSGAVIGASIAGGAAIGAMVGAFSGGGDHTIYRR